MPRFVKIAFAVQIVLVLLLMGFAPIAWNMRPFDGIRTEGVWQTDHTSDPMYPQRCMLVAFGLIASVCVTFLALVCAIRVCTGQVVALAISVGICALTLGWRMYAYWATGVFAATHGTAKVTIFDPKALIPMTWIGDFWRLPILLLFLASVVGVPTSVVLAGFGLRKRQWRGAVVVALCTGVTVAAYLSSPNYMYWLMD